MSRPTMEAYLSRSITMQGLADMILCSEARTSGVPCVTPPKGYYDPQAYQQEIDMLGKLNARFIGRTMGMWGGEYQLVDFATKGAKMVNDINEKYDKLGLERPIIQGGIFEYITAQVSAIKIPQDVANEFGYTLASNDEVFSVAAIRYATNDPSPPYDLDQGWTPDMSRIQTQMWFYYVATQYIMSGCEAIHFGQVQLMNKNDPNNEAWWKVLSKIRAFAAANAPRHLVLCDAHTRGEFYTDPQGTRRLLFDFHSSVYRVREDMNNQWPNAGGGGGLIKLFPEMSPQLYQHSQAGQTVLGSLNQSLGNGDTSWDTTTPLPFIVEIDNGPSNKGAEGTASYGNVIPWNWDEITWFSKQSNNYRNQWLKYAYYQIQCLDKNGHMEMPGMKYNQYHASNGLTNNPTGTSHGNQQDMIERLWKGSYDNDWAFSDVSANSVSNVGTPELNVAGNSVSYGDNVFYIGTDGLIYAYNKNGSTWQTTSPSWVASASNIAGQDVGQQVRAAGDLIANPARQELYYRGVDNEIHGFKVIDPWRFSYFNLSSLSSRNLTSNEKVKSNLILAADNLLCYISTGNQVYCYVYNNNQWVPSSPSWIANATVDVSNQAPAAGGLVVNPSHSRLYYQGTDNYIHGFVIDGYWNYKYFDLPKTQQGYELVLGSLVCANDTHLYYIGQNSRVYGMLLNGSYGDDSAPTYGGNWGKISPSYSAQLTPNGLHEQTLAAGSLAASPDGNTLAYIGTDNNLHGFRVLDDYNSEYFNYPGPTDSFVWPTDYVRFKSNTELFYTSSHTENHPYWAGDGAERDNDITTSKLAMLQLTALSDACSNPAIALIDAGGPYTASVVASSPTTSARTLSQRQAALTSDAGLAIYPNPATSTLQVSVQRSGTTATQAQLNDIYGRKIRTVELTASGQGLYAGSVPVHDVAAGIYVLIVTDSQGKAQTKKVVIQH